MRLHPPFHCPIGHPHGAWRLALRHAAVLVLLGTVGAAWADLTAADIAAERAAIKAERRAIEARHTAAREACLQRFVVSACLDDARRTRTAALKDVDVRELALADTERQQRAQRRQSRIEGNVARRAAAASAAGDAAPWLPLPASAAAPGKQPATAPALRGGKPAEARADDAARRQSRAEQAVRDQQQRNTDAAERKAASAARQARREQSGKPRAAPLPPVDGASAPSSAASGR